MSENEQIMDVNHNRSIDELFSVLDSKHEDQKRQPFSERNLPRSFFTPPQTGTRSGNHSAQNSIDGNLGVPTGLAERPVIMHSRNRSAPATLDHNQLGPPVSISLDQQTPTSQAWPQVKAEPTPTQSLFLSHRY